MLQTLYDFVEPYYCNLQFVQYLFLAIKIKQVTSLTLEAVICEENRNEIKIMQ